jgi:hypothetical protein
MGRGNHGFPAKDNGRRSLSCKSTEKDTLYGNNVPRKTPEERERDDPDGQGERVLLSRATLY